jgi:hypothetical protein
LTLWGKQAESFTHEDNPVVAFKGVKVGDFGGELLVFVQTGGVMVGQELIAVDNGVSLGKQVVRCPCTALVRCQ